MTDSTWTDPESELLERIRDRLGGESEGEDEDTTAVLATLVDVEGSAYRRPGAKMLFDADGGGTGAITAGCLEDELQRAATEVRETGQPRLVSYDLREDGESDVWGLGVGCNGRLEILLEPLAESLRPAVTAFDEGRDVAICTVLADDGPLECGDRAYYHPDERGGRFDADSDPADWPTDALDRPARELVERGRGDRLERTLDGRRLEVFVDGFVAPPELLICGAGHDVAPVVELAAAEFRVTVVGFRGAVDLTERFPEADRTVTTSPARLRDALELDDRTYAVVMSHNVVDDRLAVDELLRSPAPYVGLLGPRERFEEMRAAFGAEGRQFTTGELERLYTPIGLDLGSGSPYGIAHSIVAEVLAVANDREPGHLSARDGPIHERVDVADGRE
ncbi:XdhC family protein [Natronoglomus mannanivorans]|uniref:XdhC family protein n=1 Tax=Natronoglomus mannanivorans TaxID=2979990 RepID=A0AAP2Z073_9EURY|nr:XdhC family protein [Halobacteria archaeon AArc-xg1-1]